MAPAGRAQWHGWFVAQRHGGLGKRSAPRFGGHHQGCREPHEGCDRGQLCSPMLGTQQKGRGHATPD